MTVIQTAAQAAECQEHMMTEPIEAFLSDWASAERAGDVGRLETLLTDDFTAVGPLGFILPRQGWLARHRSGDLSYQAFTLDEVLVRPLGEAAVIIARNNTRGSYQGHPIPEAVRATLVLVAEAGGWKLAAMHMSFIAGTSGAPPVPGPVTGRASQRNA
jgi:ketosteroid isomerase-like protein